MKQITDKEYKVWLSMYDFIYWNFEGDYKNKLLDKINTIVSMSNASLIKRVE